MKIQTYINPDRDSQQTRFIFVQRLVPGPVLNIEPRGHTDIEVCERVLNISQGCGFDDASTAWEGVYPLTYSDVVVVGEQAFAFTNDMYRGPSWEVVSTDDLQALAGQGTGGSGASPDTGNRLMHPGDRRRED